MATKSKNDRLCQIRVIVGLEISFGRGIDRCLADGCYQEVAITSSYRPPVCGGRKSRDAYTLSCALTGKEIKSIVIDQWSKGISVGTEVWSSRTSEESWFFEPQSDRINKWVCGQRNWMLTMIETKNLDYQIKSCYISAPIGANIENIRASLLQRNVRLLSPSDEIGGQDLNENVLGLISKSDFVIGVLTRERRSQSVLFDLGQAVALGRQIVVFAPPKSGYVPLNLQKFLVLRINLLNRAAIDFAFDQILSSPLPRKKAQRIVADVTQGMGTRAYSFLAEADVAVAANDERRFEEIVTRAIRESDVEIALESPSEDRKIDLAVWSDKFQRLFGHPLLIQMKVRIGNEEHARNALRQCAEITAKSGITWSLLLYGHGPPISGRSWASVAPTVLVISVAELMKKMCDQSFVDIIIGLRNRRVHGGNF